MRRKIILICYCLLISNFLAAQHYIEDLGVHSFRIVEQSDTIDFINVSEDINKTKPTIIFCQGSQPIPLIIDFNDGETIIPSINNFDYKKLSKEYNIVVISKPSIPLRAKEEDLNNRFEYITNPQNINSYPSVYLDQNYLDRYVERINQVINYLIKQKWVDKNRIYIIGHSEGAKVATKVAIGNNNIGALGFLSGNPLGRVDEFIRRYREQQRVGLISVEKAQEEINKTYAWWEWLNERADSTSHEGQDSPRNILSFSQPVLNDLLNLQIPIFVGYGTEDIISSYCDLLPLDLIRKRKNNYEFKPYLGLEHNFFEVDYSGKTIYDKNHWDDVMKDFMLWLKDLQ